MAIIKFQFAVLMAEILSLDDENGCVPWRWPQFEKTMKFPPGTYPTKGMIALPMSAPDYKHVADTERTFKALQAFYRAAIDCVLEDKSKEKVIDDKKFRELCSTLKSNHCMQGLKIYRTYFEKILKRARFSMTIDQLLNDNEGFPWQYAKLTNLPWPTNKVRAADVAISVVGTKLCIDIFGEEVCVTVSTVDSKATTLLHSILSTAWDRATKREPRLRMKIMDVTNAFNEAWEAFGKMHLDTPNRTKLRMLEKLLKLARKRSDLLRTLGEDGLLQATETEDEVLQLLQVVQGKGECLCDNLSVNLV